ncbi:MAG: hypothetical protein ACI8ZB_004369 [Desulforhopalus sp.]|jgi:hypothetical protein
MDTIINPTFNQPKTISNQSFSKTKSSNSFSDLITQYTIDGKPQQINNANAVDSILVGEITPQNPTVSELLIQHNDLHASTWGILGAAQNRDRDYTNIQPGTRIYYNATNGELTWSDEKNNSFKLNQPSPQPELPPHQLYQSMEATQKETPTTANLSLGKITETVPTVSRLLKNHPQLREQTWNLIANTVNEGKPFHTIPPGTEIFLNSDTKEITWTNSGATVAADRPTPNVPVEPAALATSAASNHTTPAADLSEAVQQYLGTPYEKINCYELIVKGLDQMNIPYSGKGGLYTELTKMATDRGMASNAYLTGEGIVKAAGTLVLSKNYSGQGNWEEEAASLMSAVEPLLDNGQILSFSTNKRGHTGIVSRQNDQWTFINSGRLDNSVTADSVHRGVGEEVLQEEVRNWYKLAHKNNEILSVTLGQLGHEKIRT